MEFNIKMIAFMLLCSILTWNCAFSQDENFRPLYDVVHSLQEISESIGNVKHMENIDYNLDGEDQEKSFKLSVLNSLLDNSNDNTTNSTCERDINYAKKFLKLEDLLLNPWAFQMLDAFGKPESGFLKGNLKWLGDFDECRDVYAPKSNDGGDYYGKYCLLGVNVSNLVLTIGVCVPETCESSDFIYKGVNITVFDLTLNVSSVTCQENKRQLTGAAIATICVMSFFGVLAFLGSAITVAKYLRNLKSKRDPECQQEPANSEQQKSGCKDDDEPLVIMEGSRTKLSIFIEECQNFLNCFCVFTNGAKLLNVDATEGQLLCLHGIRFLSMSWVILCHVYMAPVAQLRSVIIDTNQVDNFAFQAILNGWYSVDSFFLLSGFLMAYLYFQEAAKKKGKTPWLYFYIHRYLRLTPVYMIVLGFYTTILPYLGSGPYWPVYDIEPYCQKSWWWNLIYINNFNTDNQCMGWAWYLANDMQFFVVSPLFLISLWRWPKIGYTFLILFLCGNWITCFVLTYHYDLGTGSLSNIMHIADDPDFLARFMKYFDKIYGKPYARDAPYLVGIALGYILFKKKITNFKLNKITLFVGWMVATPLGLTCVYGLYHRTPGLLAASFFNALSKTCYSLALGWVIFVCLLGQGGVVNKILSYKLFIPLSRLTYCAYLIHLIVVETYTMSLKNTIVFSHYTMVTLFLGLILISYAFSLLVSLIFESPIIRLEKHIRSKFFRS